MIDDHDKPKIERITDLPTAISITTISEHQQLFN